MKQRRLVVVGAGPIGLETALRAAGDGFDVTVLESGRVGEAIRKWGHVRFFTPFEMNSTAAGRKAVAERRRSLISEAPTDSAIETHESKTTESMSPPLPDADAIVTGSEFCDAYLQPLAQTPELVGRVRESHEVVAVSRGSYGKSDHIGRPHRASEPFRILVVTPDDETIIEADVLMDCTGFTSKHRPIGSGGIPCPGESRLLSDDNYRIPDITGTRRQLFARQHTLVVGSGYSAATSVCLLSQLAEQEPGTAITWITRGNRETPVCPIPNDTLPERASLTERANELAKENKILTWLSGPLVESIHKLPSGFDVHLNWPTTDRLGDEQSRVDRLGVNRIIANAGLRPNTKPFDELQVHRCYATDGPIRFAAHLLGESSSDCLQQTSGGVELLKNPEPDFYILGASSYGRDSRFLLQFGLQQIGELFDSLKAGDPATS